MPEYVGGIVNFLNSAKNGENAEPFEAGDGSELAEAGKPLLDEAGITLLPVSPATDTNAFMVTQDYSDSNGVTELSDLEGVSVKLAAAPDCEGRLDCEGGLTDQYGIDVTEVLPLGYASDETYQSVLSGESELGEPARPTAPWSPRAWSCSRTTSRSSRPRTSCRPCRRSSSPPTRTSRTSSTR